jgi:endonuclease G
MRYIFTILLFIGTILSYGQDTLRYDTLITNKAYKSYYSKKYEAPVAVSYLLYHGGGNCSRETYDFKNDIKGLKTAYNSDYRSSGYDKGHMANAEDFAYDCELDEMTFRFYNCVPQTPELNRGPWKQFETVIRTLSQTDSLIVMCYNEFGNTKIKNVYVPTKCYKFVYDLKTKKMVFAFYYTNTATPEFKDIRKSKAYAHVTRLMKL